MTDNLTPEQRHRSMSRVRNKDTDLERTIRSALHRRGLRFRKHVRELPGSPDVVFPRSRVAVFIDGDFWHGFKFSEWKDSVSEFWQAKIQTNIDRDKRNHRSLEEMDWLVIRLWQHEIESNPQACVERVIVAVASRQTSET